MSAVSIALESLCKRHPKLLRKGGLCVALVVTRAARKKQFPLNPESLRTTEGGQVAGLGKAAVQKILEEHGITTVLAEEGGRTSRGSLGLMKEYANTLNKLHAKGHLSLEEAESWWIEKVQAHFSSEGPKFHFDSGKSLKANIEDLLEQAREAQQHAKGSTYFGAMLQHLVGAKLDLVLGNGVITHYGASVADRPKERRGDFEIDGVVIHVTTHPTEALARKCAENIQAGQKPVIVTVGDGVAGSAFLLRNESLENRVDVIDATQFMTANIYERSLFKVSAYKVTFMKLLRRYNELVAAHETDPALKVNLNDRLTS
jgi:hypothetical protein